ncbi:MAG: nucleoside hydrolase [Armatimonadota bacterium]
MPGPSPVIIDTDPGVDDALALLLAGASPELDVLAVTTVGGNVGLDLVTENVRRIVPIAWAGRPLPPIYRGAAEATEPAAHVHGPDGLGGVSELLDEAGAPLYPAAAPVEREDAAAAILRLARQHPGEVTLITLGPLTNLALALSRDRQAARLLREVVIMGGAFRVPGNTTPWAEYNVVVDPESAQAVCDSGIPLRWVPVDCTHRCVLRRDQLRPPSAPSLRSRFIREICEFTFGFHHRETGEWGCYLHDPLAVGAAIWPDLLRSVPLRVDVETRGRLTRGMTVADFRVGNFGPRPTPNSEVCLEVDADAFVERLLDRIG